MKRIFLSALIGLCIGMGPVVFAAGVLPAPMFLPPPRATHTTPSFLVNPMVGLPHNYTPPYQPNLSLPLPSPTLIPPKVLSLRDAIMLALRSNQSVASSEIQRIVDKYAVILARQVFRPQYTFKLTSTVDRAIPTAWDFTPTFKVLTPIGTEVSIDYSNTFQKSPGLATITVRQPLLKGFGAVNTVTYYDALVTEEIAKLTFKNNIIAVVDAVITSYRTLVGDHNNLKIQRRTLKESAKALKQYELKVKVGKMAPSDLLQQKSNYATTQLALVQQENTTQQDYQTFLQNMGFVPTAVLTIKKALKTTGFKIPSMDDAIKRGLDGNIAYHQSLLTLENTQRAIITAKDGRKWTFDVTASTAFGIATNPSQSPGPEGSGPRVAFDFEIPIDNVQGKADLVDARIAVEQARLTLEQTRDALIGTVISQLRTLKNDQKQIDIAETGVKMQRLTLKAARIKLKYGKSTVFEVTQDQDQLLSQETSLVETKISYLNDITNLYSIFGETLDRWEIKLRY